MHAVSQRKEAAWFTLLMPCLGLAGMLLGGRRVGRSSPKVHEFVTRATIHAAPETVWRILSDATGYAKWNPEIVSLAGLMAPGERIQARVKLGSGAIRAVPARNRIRGADDDGVDRRPTLGLFAGRRIFTVTPGAGVTEFLCKC